MKIENDILQDMLTMEGCLPGLVDEAKCRHAVDIMLWEAQMVHDYRAYQVKLLKDAGQDHSAL